MRSEEEETVPSMMQIFAMEVHMNAIAKGWWQTDYEGRAVFNSRPFGELMMLVLSELAEAFEIARMKEFDPKRVWFSGTPLANDVTSVPDELHRKPEGFGIELADVLIRLLETAIAGKLEIWEYTEKTTDSSFRTDKELNVGVALMDISRNISMAYAIVCKYTPESLHHDTGWAFMTLDRASVYIGRAVSDTITLGNILGIDVFELAKMKHTYNLTRSYRHGGKRC